MIGPVSDKQRRFYCQANLAAWEQAAPIHAHLNQARLLEQITDPGFNNLHAHSMECLSQVDLAGSTAAQLCCNNGLDLLSLKKLGAGSCVGFDASPQFIEQACALSQAAGYDDVEFVETDIYAMPAVYQGRFDIAMTTVGVLSWMPDLQRFFEITASLLQPGGYYFIEEIHPVLLMYDDKASGQCPLPKYSYFQNEPWCDTDGLDYFTGEAYDALPSYSFQHTLSGIMTAAIRCGFTLRRFSELDKDISGLWPQLQDVQQQPPMAVTMLWQKQG